jgi:regulator of RNase E activity RraA
MELCDKELEALRQLDTPTVCNALELLLPEARGAGFNRRPLICPVACQGPVVGYARTATIRCATASGKSAAAANATRLRYYEMIEQGPRPSLAVIQDLEQSERAIGAFWGEVQSNIHAGLGCHGVITDGAVRDIDQFADGFFALAGAVMPSHVWADIVDIDIDVEVAGMRVSPGDLIHADRHGCVVVPHALAALVPAAAATIVRREAVILDAARQPGFGVKQLEAAMQAGDEIH